MSDTTQDLAPMLLKLGPEMTIAQAAEIHAQLLDAITQQPHGLSLDLSGVGEFDSAGIQLLLSTRHSLHAQGVPLLLQSPSAVVLAALKCYGLDPHLQDMGTTAH